MATAGDRSMRGLRAAMVPVVVLGGLFAAESRAAGALTPPR